MRVKFGSSGLALVVTLTSCAGVEFASAQSLAEDACNGWSAATEGDQTRQDSLDGLARAGTNARRAADSDDTYVSLADALEGLHASAKAGDIERFMEASDAAFDECWEIMDSDSEVRRILEEELGK